MSVLIDQKKGPVVRSVYVKHNKSKYKVIESTELTDYLADGFHEMVNPTWMYHISAGSDVFGEDELEELRKQGWVNSPAKLITKAKPVTHVPILSPDEMDLADKYAREMLSGKGLSLSGLMRKFGMGNKTANKKRFKPIYEAIFATFSNDIKKQGLCWFWDIKEKV